MVDFKKKLKEIRAAKKSAKPVRMAVPKKKKPAKPAKRTSLVPKHKSAPADPELPSIDTAITRTSTRNMTQSLISNYRGLQVQIKELEQSKKEVGEEIVEVLKNWKLKGVRYGQLTATREQGMKRTLSRIRLIENGVSPTTLKKSTTETAFERFSVRGTEEKEAGTGSGEEE